MFKKTLIGVLAVAIGGTLARSGYAFGKQLAQGDAASTTQVIAVDPEQG
jgi:hypothetical protein